MKLSFRVIASSFSSMMPPWYIKYKYEESSQESEYTNIVLYAGLDVVVIRSGTTEVKKKEKIREAAANSQWEHFTRS